MTFDTPGHAIVNALEKTGAALLLVCGFLLLLAAFVAVEAGFVWLVVDQLAGVDLNFNETVAAAIILLSVESSALNGGRK